jgi:hypothetical protein
MKSFILLLLLLGVIGGGVGYSLLNSPDFTSQLMFKQILKSFANKAIEFESQFRKQQSMEPQQKELLVEFQTPFGDRLSEKLQLVVSKNIITIKIPNSSSALAGQSIVLEPVINENVLRWKCINGDVVIRVRSKNCRLGNGETLADMREF